MDSFITFCAKDLVGISVLVTLYLLYKLKGSRRAEFALMLVAGGILSYLLAKIGHHLYNDPRPFISDGSKALFSSSHDNGFPSDHTLLASFLAFAALAYARTEGAVLLVIALLVAWGRVAGHVHHLKDVVGSFVFTAIATFVVVQLIKAKQKAPPSRERPSDDQA